MAISGAYADGDAINFNDCEIEIDLTPATSAFADVSTWSTSIECDPETVQTAESNTFGHPSAIVFAGKPQAQNVTVTLIYTEGATDPFKNLYDTAAGARVDVRWVPKGGTVGDYQYTTVGGRLTQKSFPVGAADGSTATTVAYIIRCGGVSQGAVI